VSLPVNNYFVSPITISNVSVPANVPSGSYLLAFGHHHVYCQWKPLELAPGSTGKAFLSVQVSDTQIQISEVATGIADVVTDADLLLDPETVVYTLSGVRLKAANGLPSGVYILVRDGQSRKIVIP
jgi:hypothetical protein